LTLQTAELAEFEKFDRELGRLATNAEKLEKHFQNSAIAQHDDAHTQQQIVRLHSLRADATALQAARKDSATDSAELARRVDALSKQVMLLRKQSPVTLFRLRLVEIGLPLALSVVTIWLTLRYPLTEARCYEIKESLKRRRAELAS
jgi:hypothetical protein